MRFGRWSWIVAEWLLNGTHGHEIHPYNCTSKKEKKTRIPPNLQHTNDGKDKIKSIWKTNESGFEPCVRRLKRCAFEEQQRCILAFNMPLLYSSPLKVLRLKKTSCPVPAIKVPNATSEAAPSYNITGQLESNRTGGLHFRSIEPTNSMVTQMVVMSCELF